jgi:hypothetical protein
MKYHLYIIIVLLSIIPFKLTSQFIDTIGITPPVPTIGWDSLGKSLRCPEFIARAGIQGRILAILYIDSSGKAEDVSVGDFIDVATFDSLNSELVRGYILNYFSIIKWNPAVQNGKKVDYRLSIPIYFMFKEEGQADPIIVQRARPHIMK